MKFIYLTLLILFFNLPAIAQVAPQNATAVDTVREKIYREYKALCLKHWQSPTHKKSDSLQKAFYKKVHVDKNIKFDPVNYTPLNYIKANLANTDFKSYEEAEKEWKAHEDSITLDVAANKDVMDYEVNMLLTHPGYTDLMTDVLLEVFYETLENRK